MKNLRLWRCVRREREEEVWPKRCGVWWCKEGDLGGRSDVDVVGVMDIVAEEVVVQLR